MKAEQVQVPPGGVPVDRGIFEVFYRAEYPGMVHLAWLLTHSPSACEDLTQEAFAAVYRHFPELDNPAGYLRRTLVNLCGTWRRNESSLRRRILRLREDHCETPVPDPGLILAVRRLPYRQRVVMVARYWADWSEAEIADALGCRPGTVKSLASRALTQLRSEVGTDDRRGFRAAHAWRPARGRQQSPGAVADGTARG